MGFKCGIVGLPNVGKSTLFNALTPPANYPFCTIEAKVGDVAVPDPRLAALADVAGSKEIIPTRLTFVDIAGLVRGASKGEGLGNQFLANIRECDAIAHVVRCFEDGDVTHVEGRIDPLSDIATVETELMLADLDSLERRIVGMEKRAKGGDKGAKDILALADRSLAELREGRPARAAGVSREEHDLFQSLGLLSSKPLCLQRRRGRSRQGQRLFGDREGTGRQGGRRVREDRKRNRRAAGSRAEGLSGGRVPPRARPQSRDPRRLRPAPSRHLLHCRPEGNAGMDGGKWGQGAAGGRRLEGKDYVVADGDVLHFRFAN